MARKGDDSGERHGVSEAVFGIVINGTSMGMTRRSLAKQTDGADWRMTENMSSRRGAKFGFNSHPVSPVDRTDQARYA
jgi:hypothetical protein